MTVGLAVKLDEATGDISATTEEVSTVTSSLVLALRLDETTGNIGDNLVDNGDFEVYTVSPGVPPSWVDNASGTATFEKETTLVNSGSSAVKMTMGGGNTNGMRTNNLPVVAGRSYYVEAWARTSGAGTSRARILLRNVTDAVSMQTVNGTLLSTTYEKLSLTFIAAAGKAYRIHLNQNSSGTNGDIVYFDDVTVREIVAEDHSGNARHGILGSAVANTDGPSIGASGKVGTSYAWASSGDKHEVVIGRIPEVSGTTDWSMEMWLYVNDADPTSGNGRGVFLSGSTGGSMGAFRNLNAITFHLREVAGGIAFSRSHTVVQNTWVHYVFTHKAMTEVKLYVNGVLNGTSAVGTYPTGPPVNTNTWRLGGNVTGAGNTNDGGFTGRIDEARLYSKVLTADEALARYNATVGGTRPTDDSQAPDDPETVSVHIVDFDLVEGIPEVGQALAIRLRTYLGEDVISPTVGLPWPRLIGIFTPELIQGEVTRCLMRDSRVYEVGEITSSLNRTTRVLSLEVPVTLKDGATLTLVELFGV